jgi:hypothetical protein
MSKINQIKTLINVNAPNTQLHSRDSSVGIAAAYGLDDWGSIPVRDKIFIFSTASTWALGPSQYLAESVSLVVKRPGDGTLSLLQRSRMVELYLSFLKCLHAKELN